jgi:hypothetical protein
VQFDRIGGVTLGNLPEEIESYRDRLWRREPESRVENVLEAERFIMDVGFCAAMTDARRPGPSLYVAVCGRRDAHMPRNVQKDPESNLTWTIKDEIARRGRVYYGKLRGNRSIFIAPNLISSFNAVFGLERRQEKSRLSGAAQRVLKVLRKEWELATADLREASGIKHRTDFTRAIEELQRTLKILPSEIVYVPKFTYIWSLAEGRFADELNTRMPREEALREIARGYLTGAGMTLRGELARVTSLSNPDAGLGNWALVDEGFAVRRAPGVYQLNRVSAAAGAGL